VTMQVFVREHYAMIAAPSNVTLMEYEGVALRKSTADGRSRTLLAQSSCQRRYARWSQWLHLVALWASFWTVKAGFEIVFSMR